MDTVEKKDSWIVLASGKQFFPLEPNIDLINIEDIAHGLSNLCRFAGHSKFFYSVAQHSFYASQMIDPKYALSALLHDASEGMGLSDIVRPLKYRAEFEFYRKSEYNLQSMIYSKYGLGAEPPEVKVVDDRMLSTELRDLMPPFATRWLKDIPPYHFHIEYMDPTQAKKVFLQRFAELTK